MIGLVPVRVLVKIDIWKAVLILESVIPGCVYVIIIVTHLVLLQGQLLLELQHLKLSLLKLFHDYVILHLLVHVFLEDAIVSVGFRLFQIVELGFFSSYSYVLIRIVKGLVKSDLREKISGQFLLFNYSSFLSLS